MFIIKMLYDALYSALSEEDDDDVIPLDPTKEECNESSIEVVRQHGRQHLDKEFMPTPTTDSLNKHYQSVIESEDSKRIEWNKVFSHKSDLNSSLNMTADLRQVLERQRNRADRKKSNLKDSIAEKAHKEIKQIIASQTNSDDTEHSTETLKPYPSNDNASETEQQRREFHSDAAQKIPNPVALTDVELLPFKSLSTLIANSSYVLPEEAKTFKSQERDISALAAQMEVSSNVLVSFESLAMTTKFATRIEQAEASTSQVMQTVAPVIMEGNTPIPTTTTDSQSYTSLSKPESTLRPTRVSRSQDQQVGDSTSDDNGNEHPPASTADEGMQTRKKEKQD